MSQGRIENVRAMNPQINIRIRVRLEPVLEEKVATFSPSKRRALAIVYERWAHQLRLSARILEIDAKPSQRRRLKGLPHRKLLLN